jgi:hypothetical protein
MKPFNIIKLPAYSISVINTLGYAASFGNNYGYDTSVSFGDGGVNS